MKKAVVLLSGGLDSTTTLYWARKKGYKCWCLIFDYGQKHRKEILSAKKIAEKTNSSFKVIKIDFPWKGSALTDKNVSIPENRSILLMKKSIPATYVPARNIIFISFAVSFAEVIGASRIFIGANAIDFSGYPDCRPEFFKAFSKAISKGTKRGNKIKIEVPFLYYTKAKIVKVGISLSVPFELTWSCYKGKSRPCRKCDSCLLRKKGFKEAGIKDPLLTKHR